MSRRLCKLSRNEILDGLGAIHRVVSNPRFVCRACARAAHDSSSLCKPTPLIGLDSTPLVKLTKKQLKQRKKIDKKLGKLMAKRTKLLQKH